MVVVDTWAIVLVVVCGVGVVVVIVAVVVVIDVVIRCDSATSQNSPQGYACFRPSESPRTFSVAAVLRLRQALP